jgi:radical SAM superfamily enzyme YgiQ (UPF0313 family)
MGETLGVTFNQFENKMSSRNLKIYLADLIHDRHIYNYCAPLNVGYIAATVNQRFGKEVETQIFKFPDDLISAIKSSPPDILALSNYDWNVNLNRALIKIAREINPQLLVIMGGPNIKKTPEGVRGYLLNHPADMSVVNEGEDAFSKIVEYVLGLGHCDLRKAISSSGLKFENAAYLQSETQSLMLGEKPKSASEKNITFPSPWLTGILDPFINNPAFPLQSLIETNRNCPYQCHFCVWGDFDLNSIRLFDFDTVIEELRYIFKKSESHFNLWIADANFGILDRDIEIAEELRRLSDKYKNIDFVCISQAKNSVKRNLEISKILGRISIPDFAVQTLTPGVLEHSGRKNISNEAIKEYVAGVRDGGDEVSTHVLVGLPGETKADFIDSMKNIMDYGFLRAGIGDIRLLAGSVMAENDFIEKFGLESRFRVIPSAYGEYGGINVIEYEECIRKTNTMSAEDIIGLRLFNANYFVLYFVELGRPILDFVQRNGIHPIDLIGDISDHVDIKSYPLLSGYIARFTELANAEWYETVDKANSYYLQPENFKKIMEEGFPKLNFEYAAQLITKKDLRTEFMEWIGENIKQKLPEKILIVDELVNFCVERVYSYPYSDKQDTMELSFDSAKHLAEYVNDYKTSNDDEGISKYDEVRVKGEHRDTFGSNFLKDSKENAELFVNNSTDSFNIKLAFDTDKGKTAWIKTEVERNGGARDLSLAIQLILQNNQKSFLRSWALQ